MRKRASALVLSIATAVLGACAPAEPEADVDTAEPTADESSGVSNGSVAAAVSSSCSTSSVKALSLQIIAEANCIEPGAYAKIPSRPNLDAASYVFLFLEQPARDRLVAALDANPNRVMRVNSGLRTVAQQYLLYRWSQQGRCGISIAARPGRSNHETGLALDLDNASAWRSSLESRGFDWAGSSDPVHFDYEGPGAEDHRGLDVLAFQRLWNRNHASDLIAEDGDYGPQTEARLKQAPAAGFPIGASCAPDPGTCDPSAGDCDA